MGEVELNSSAHILTIYSHLVTYGDAADEALTAQIREEVETMWNEPNAIIRIEGAEYRIVFSITAELLKSITDLELYQNVDPRNNYFRIEEFAHGNISFVDGIGCNSGYFKLENLYKGSTTAAHEYGHTIGLEHPQNVDIRGKGIPGIMFPRGTLVDAAFQYDPSKPAGVAGGTMHPMHRKVLVSNIEDLQLQKLRFRNNKAILGAFTNVYHENHASISEQDFFNPVIAG